MRRLYLVLQQVQQHPNPEKNENFSVLRKRNGKLASSSVMREWGYKFVK